MDPAENDRNLSDQRLESPAQRVKSGKPKKLCGQSKFDGNTCTRVAGAGTDHPGYGWCSSHGGRSEDGIRLATHERARELGEFYGLPKDVHPGDVLLIETRRTAGHVEFLRDLIGKLENEDAEAGPSEVLKEWLGIYHFERTHLTKTAKMALDAGVQERMVSLAEAQGAMVADAIERILTQLQLTDQQRRLVPLVVPTILRQMRTGQPNPMVLELEAGIDPSAG